MHLLKGEFDDRRCIYSIIPDEVPGFVFPDDFQAVLVGIDFYERDVHGFYLDIDRDEHEVLDTYLTKDGLIGTAAIIKFKVPTRPFGVISLC